MKQASFQWHNALQTVVKRVWLKVSWVARSRPGRMWSGDWTALSQRCDKLSAFWRPRTAAAARSSNHHALAQRRLAEVRLATLPRWRVHSQRN